MATYKQAVNIVVGIAAWACGMYAHAVTTTLEYEDTRDAETRAVASNCTAAAALAATNYTDAAATAATNYTDAAIADIPPPDFSTSNATLCATIEAVAPAPGDYANVSNLAVNAVQTTDSDWQDITNRVKAVIRNDGYGGYIVPKASAAEVLEASIDNTYFYLSVNLNRYRVTAHGQSFGVKDLAYLSEVDTVAQSATNYTDAAAMTARAKTDLAVYTMADWHPSYDVEYGVGFFWNDELGLWVGDGGSGFSDHMLSYSETEKCWLYFSDGYTNRISGSRDALTLNIGTTITRPSVFVATDDTLARKTEVGAAVTNIVRDISLGGIWDRDLEVWWTPVMSGGSLTYQATTNVNLNAED